MALGDGKKIAVGRLPLLSILSRDFNLSSRIGFDGHFGDLSSILCLCLSPRHAAPALQSSTKSGPSSRPPWVTDPNFAERYRPDKTSTVVTQHRQPAQPTPEQNRSSILQAAQQNPESDSGRTPLCAACNKIIRYCRWFWVPPIDRFLKISREQAEREKVQLQKKKKLRF